MFNSPQSRIDMTHWDFVWNTPIEAQATVIHVGKSRMPLQSGVLATPFGDISAQFLAAALEKQNRHRNVREQEQSKTHVATVVYDLTQNPLVMANYFPINNGFDDDERKRFGAEVHNLMRNPNFALRIWADRGRDVTATASPALGYMVAGHIVEVLYYRPNFRARFFSQPRHFNLYLSIEAYHDGGGVAGGCYDPASQSIKLLASRLFEGFHDRSPGVAPFLHEFGHMLDVFHPADATIGHARGLLPGMFPDDGELFTPEARDGFTHGKRIEHERYERARQRKPGDPNDIPLGHPYVFQNDSEFIAGYLEMFFRNPHRFHELNPVLYGGFVALFKQDPRRYWTKDFGFYIQANSEVYLGHRQGIHPSGLKVFS